MARGDADGTCDGPSVAVTEPDSWLMELKPPSYRRVVTSVLHVPPAKPPKIKSTVSGGASVTPLSPGAKSTRQRGVKHSITKRFTRCALREVRLPSLRPRSASSATRRIVEPQVTEVLAGRIANFGGRLRSWPKNAVPEAGERTRPRVVRRAPARSVAGVPAGRSIPGDFPWQRWVSPGYGARTPAGDPVRPRCAPVRRAVQPVGGMALRSRRRSGILLGTRGTRAVKAPSHLCTRSSRPYS